MIIQIFEFKIQQTFTWWNLYKSFDFSKNFNLRRSCSKLFRNSSSDIKLGIKQHLNGLVWITHPFSGEKGIKNKNMLIYFLNPLTPKIWLLILPFSWYTFPCKLVMRIWYSIKVISCTWWLQVFSLPVWQIMYGYYRERLHINHFWELKGVEDVIAKY